LLSKFYLKRLWKLSRKRKKEKKEKKRRKPADPGLVACWPRGPAKPQPAQLTPQPNSSVARVLSFLLSLCD